MNVLKADFISKQKRLEDRRKRFVKSFFSGYHTVSKIASSSNGLYFPTASAKDAKIQTTTNPKFSNNFSHVDESVEPRSLSNYSTQAVTREHDVTNQREKLYDGKDCTTSTSLEFQKLLEPFLHFGQENSPDPSEGPTESKNDLKKFYKKTQDFKVLEEGHLNVTGNEELLAIKGLDSLKKTPPSIPRNLKTFNNETLEQCNIFSLHVPKKQKSIREILTSKTAFQLETSKKFIRSSKDKNRTSLFVDVKTPKNKTRKSPKVSSSSRTLNSDSGAFILVVAHWAVGTPHPYAKLANGPWCSQAVTHPSINHARCCLTSVIGREPMFSACYGRWLSDTVTEGRGHARGEVGIAAMDPRRPHLVLCQISDNQRYIHSLTKMNVFDFVEVIVPNTFVDCPLPNKLYSDIRSTFPKVTLTSVQRRHFNESIGVDLIKQYCSLESNSVMVLLRDKFYALSAAAALIKYIEFTQNVRLAPQSLKVEYQGMEDTMIIDLNTANLLELVLCVSHPETNPNYSLLGVINYCHTKGGVRLLRANILQPPCSLAKIETRLECVTELINNPLLLCALEAAVSSFSNLEDLLNLCMHAPQQDGLRAAEFQLKYTLLLKTMLELLPKLRGALQDAKSSFFCEVREKLEDPRYSMILDRILQTVTENAKTVKGSVAAHLHGCFAVKTGVNSLLDIAKKTYCEIVQEISDHVAELRENHKMPLRLAFSANKGFHIQYTVPPAQKNQSGSSLPSQFILALKSKTKFSFYTAELVALDQRSQHVLNEIKLMTNVILFELLTDIRHYIGCLFNLCEHIAELDVLVSFAHVGSGTNYVRPKFGEELNLRDSRHPILDVIYDKEVVANDVLAKTGKNFTILTGPNQSGKSIYIRQIALLQIMAQIGCYVPAREATFRLTDRLFSRLGFDDSIESNASTLIVEMRDIEYMKQNKTPRSLFVIDELCRGTSIDEGTSLAFAICEELLNTSAFIFFTTHYLLLTKLEEMYYNVTNYHFESKIETTPEGKPYIQFTHKRKAGPTKADSYGLQIAEMTCFPKDVYIKAKEISVKLFEERKPCRNTRRLVARYELSLQLRAELLNFKVQTDWKKMEPVIQYFQQLYITLTKEGAIEKNSKKLNFISLEPAKNTVSKQNKTMSSSMNSQCSPDLSSQKKSLCLDNRPMLCTHAERPNKIVKNTARKTKRDLVTMLARAIKNKYKKIILKKNITQASKF